MNMSRRLWGIGLVLVAWGGSIGCQRGGEIPSLKSSSETGTSELPAEEKKLPDPHTVSVRILTSRGALEMELFPDDAPKTVENFMLLVQRGFYNGARFHRMEGGRFLQTGELTAKREGVNDMIPFEQNERRHLIGSVAMVRNEDKNSARGLFFICLEPLPDLDGKTTVFGRITAGFDVLPQIVQGDIIEKIELLPRKR